MIQLDQLQLPGYNRWKSRAKEHKKRKVQLPISRVYIHLWSVTTCPAMAPASSSNSSSEEEDLSLFASCAVSADQIEKSAEADAKKRVLKASQRPIASAARSAAATTPAQQQGADDAAPPPGSTGLDLISEKVRQAELTQPPCAPGHS